MGAVGPSGMSAERGGKGALGQWLPVSSQTERGARTFQAEGTHEQRPKGKEHKAAAVAWAASRLNKQPSPSRPVAAFFTSWHSHTAFPCIPAWPRNPQISCGWAADELWQPRALGKRGSVCVCWGGLQTDEGREGRWAGTLSHWVPKGQAGAWIPGEGPGSHPDPRRQETGLVSPQFPSARLY